MNKKDFLKVVETLDNLAKGSMFNNNLFIVGGAVRDYLLDRDIKDIDVVVEFPNGEITFSDYLKNKLHIPSVTYNRSKTVRVEIEVEDVGVVPLEITQSKQGSFNENCKFGLIKMDSQLRDLTINAIYLNVTSKQIIDPTNLGKQDLKNKILRCPNNPNDIFKDDPLRMLRILRFRSELDFTIEKNTYLGIIHNADRLEKVSVERIRDEFSKILLSETPSEGIKMMRCGYLMKHVSKYLAKTYDTPNDDGFEGNLFQHLMDVVDATEPKLEDRLGALYHDIGKVATLIISHSGKMSFESHEKIGKIMTENELKNLKYSDNIIDYVSFLVEKHNRFSNFKGNLTDMSKRTVRRIVNECGTKTRLNSLLDVIEADNICKRDERKYEQVSIFKKTVEDIEKLDGKEINKINLPINGKDIMSEFNIKEGREVAKYLALARFAYLGDPNITKDELIKYLKGHQKLVHKITPNFGY